jgi:hypothetical protein
MKNGLMCQEEGTTRSQHLFFILPKKREMFVETSYLLLSVNIEYRLKQNIPVKIAGYFVTGSTK